MEMFGWPKTWIMKSLVIRPIAMKIILTTALSMDEIMIGMLRWERLL